jgi:hypothetical protein
MLLAEAASDDAHQHQQVIFEPELIIRQSTQAAQAPDPRPRAAARG